MGGSERAIIDFVTQGTAEAEGSAEKITVDLTGTEKAAHAAKDASVAATDAAKTAQREARALAHEIRHTLHTLARVAELGKKAASALGVEDTSDTGRAIDATAEGLSGAASGARAGGMLGAFVPIPGATAAGAAIGAAVGGLIGVVSSLKESAKKIDERAEKLAEIDGKGSDRALVDAMLKQSGLSKADYIGGGGSRQVQ